jgi:hypothetical protein
MEHFDSIIHNIYTDINSHNQPSIIYMGVGTCAGLSYTDNNNIRRLELQDYHQFPPTLQNIYNTHKNLKLYIVLIDPLQEDPILMSTDDKLTTKLFPLQQWRHNIYNETIEVYNIDRITVYPFRYNVYTEINKEGYQNSKETKSINITHHLYSLHNFCIENNVTFVYHDFSGADTFINLEIYFNDNIKNNLDHIIYGFGNGNISGCYYDFTLRDAQLVYYMENSFKNRHMIRVFNINFNIYKYIELKKDNTYNKLTFNDYLTHVFDNFEIDNIDIISSQIENKLKIFTYDFKNFVLYVLRIIKDYNDAIISNDFTNARDYSWFKDNYCLAKIKKELKKKILELYSSNNRNIFNIVLDLFASYYNIEFTIIIDNCNYKNMSPYDLMLYVTSDHNKYNWVDKFDSMF